LEGWLVLSDLGQAFPKGWCLIGGQMMWLLATEHEVAPPRATEDVDVVVDVRADPALIQKLCRWLEDHDVNLDGVSADGIGRRYARSAQPGPGRVIFDVLAPDNVGSRAILTTSQGARTLETPGTRVALDKAERIDVSIGDRTGTLYRPSLLAAIAVKTAATRIPVRSNPDRDWQDAAFLLSLVTDPIAAAQSRTERSAAACGP
jgi:hypothetical protein